MHKAVMVSDETSLKKLNELLEDDWWVYQVTSGSHGSWFVVLTDSDPDDLLLDRLPEIEDEEDIEDYENLEYEHH